MTHWPLPAPHLMRWLPSTTWRQPEVNQFRIFPLFQWFSAPSTTRGGCNITANILSNVHVCENSKIIDCKQHHNKILFDFPVKWNSIGFFSSTSSISFSAAFSFLLQLNAIRLDLGADVFDLVSLQLPDWVN